MIDWDKTERITGFNEEYFKKYSQSRRKVLKICDNCKEEKWVRYDNYRDLCGSCSHKGKNNPNFGKHRSKETCEKISKKQIGKHVTEETCEKIKNAHIGTHTTEKTRKKISEANKGDRNPFYGKRHTNESNTKNSKAHKGKYVGKETRIKLSCAAQGIPYDEWENFISERKYCSDFDEELRESIREKYGRRCFLSGLPETENIGRDGEQRKLSVHHYDMDKEQGCNDKIWRLVPLSMEWHGKVHNELWEARIIWLLDNVWL